jgi:hypothetical protein
VPVDIKAYEVYNVFGSMKQKMAVTVYFPSCVTCPFAGFVQLKNAKRPLVSNISMLRETENKQLRNKQVSVILAALKKPRGGGGGGIN